MADKTPGQLAYEEDVRRKPNYDFREGPNEPRRTWDQISEWARQTWETNPTPRDWPQKEA